MGRYNPRNWKYLGLLVGFATLGGPQKGQTERLSETTSIAVEEDQSSFQGLGLRA